MADEDQLDDAEEGSAAPVSSKRKLFMMIGGGVLGALIIAVGVWFFLLRGHGEEEQQKAEVKPPAVFMDVPEVLVNLANGPGERTQYLKVKAVLEVKDATLVEQIKPSLPRVTDLFQTYLHELRPADLNGSMGLFRMKEELTKRVNAAIAPSQVNAVLFKEVIIQ